MPLKFPSCLGQQEKQTHKNTTCGCLLSPFLVHSWDWKLVLIFFGVCPLLHPPPLKKTHYSEEKFCKNVSVRLQTVTSCRQRRICQLAGVNAVQLSARTHFSTQLESLLWQNPTGWIPFSFTSIHPALNLYWIHQLKCDTENNQWNSAFDQNVMFLSVPTSTINKRRRKLSLGPEVEDFRFKLRWRKNLKCVLVVVVGTFTCWCALEQGNKPPNLHVRRAFGYLAFTLI